MTREEWEREDFFRFFTLLFQKRKIEPKLKQDWGEQDLYEAIENGTVREVMEIAGTLHTSKKYTKEVRNRVYEELVYVRELWHADPHPAKNNTQTLKVYGGTPWRYFHDFLRRKEFYNMEYALMPAPNNKYFIYVEIKTGEKTKRIKEYGIADEIKQYVPCTCVFENLVILCSRCNSFVQNQECQDNPEHKFFKKNLRCFKIDHGKELITVYDPTETVLIQNEEGVDKSPRHFNRNQDARKSSRRNRTPLPPIRNSDLSQSGNDFDDVPGIEDENIPQRPPPRYQPRFDDFVDPYAPNKTHPDSDIVYTEIVKESPPPVKVRNLFQKSNHSRCNEFFAGDATTSFHPP